MSTDYDRLVQERAAQSASGCCDCGRRGQAYTTVRQGVICRECYGKRGNDPENQHFGDTRP